MTCNMCLERGKTWPGDDPKCAFPSGGEFTEDNWNCATANAIRDIAESGRSDSEADDVKRLYVGDQTCAIIALNNDYVGICDLDACSLYVTWYKRRGRTGGMWLIGDEDDGPPRRPTEEQALIIIKHYKAQP